MESPGKCGWPRGCGLPAKSDGYCADHLRLIAAGVRLVDLNRGPYLPTHVSGTEVAVVGPGFTWLCYRWPEAEELSHLMSIAYHRGRGDEREALDRGVAGILSRHEEELRKGFGVAAHRIVESARTTDAELLRRGEEILAEDADRGCRDLTPQEKMDLDDQAFEDRIGGTGVPDCETDPN